jgi:hypothetical protein
MSRYATQGRRIVEALKRRPMTYAEMHGLGLSTSPQKRVAETLRLMPDWMLTKGTKRVGGRELTTWRVVRVNP